eukprot:TRINITY_DN29298_c0_g1_i1.p1 TRINITY_DN29298_c0_g1~~TRINITY_DN29298_c0_g1_i1.p1  ORF type:complete len:787 (-),score=124.78 TRINITY_DN29298_c0_g1_i1:535-2553(-)
MLNTILMCEGLKTPEELFSAVSRIDTFKKAFSSVDTDASGTIDRKELFLALELLNIDKRLAADMMAILDDDGSGEITWYEFVNGMTSELFREQFPDITVDTFAMLPSFFNNTCTVSTEQENAAIADLPGIERMLVRLHQYSRRRKRRAQLPPPPTAPPPPFDSPDKLSPRLAWNSELKSIEVSSQPRSPSVKNVSSLFRLSTQRSSSNDCMLSGAAAEVGKMQIADHKSHVLSESSRRRLWCNMYGAMLAGVVAGVVAAVLAKLINDEIKKYVSEEDDVILFYTLVSVGSLVWSLVEMVICCIAAIYCGWKIASICAMKLWPVDHERALILGSLARAALELGHPQWKLFGIDPQKKVNKYVLLMSGLFYLGQRSLVKFIFKLVVKKLAPRATVKAADMAALWVEIVVNSIFNYLTVRTSMIETMLCCIGPSAIVEVTSKLTQERHLYLHRHDLPGKHEPLTDEVKYMALRALGVTIIYKRSLHPNNRHLLSYLATLYADDGFISRVAPAGPVHCASAELSSDTVEPLSPDTARKSATKRWRQLKRKPTTTDLENMRLAPLQLDDEDAFFGGLAALPAWDTDFVLSILALAFFIDGRVSKAEWELMVKSCQCCDPPREPSWAVVIRVVELFVSGKPVLAADLHALVRGDVEVLPCSIRCCCFLRKCLDKLNCC